MGKTKRYCPYYQQQQISVDADIIFMPYNYLFLNESREAQEVGKIDLENAIVIIDEAHNIKSFAEEQGMAAISL